jgi:hypothetical protein
MKCDAGLHIVGVIMYDLELRYNSKSRSFKIKEINGIATKLGVIVDEKSYIIKVDSYNSKFLRLLELTKDIKNTIVLLNDREIFDIDNLINLFGCKKRLYCSGECRYIGHNWSIILNYLSFDQNGIKKNINNIPQITENLFDLDNFPEIMVDSSDKDFYLNKKELINSFQQHAKLITTLCPKFKIEKYRNRFQSLPEKIKIIRMTYEDMRKIKDEIEEEQGQIAMENIIEKIGTEFEKRLRKVLKEYFDEKTK